MPDMGILEALTAALGTFGTAATATTAAVPAAGLLGGLGALGTAAPAIGAMTGVAGLTESMLNKPKSPSMGSNPREMSDLIARTGGAMGGMSSAVTPPFAQHMQQ